MIDKHRKNKGVCEKVKIRETLDAPSLSAAEHYLVLYRIGAEIYDYRRKMLLLPRSESRH